MDETKKRGLDTRRHRKSFEKMYREFGLKRVRRTQDTSAPSDWCVV